MDEQPPPVLPEGQYYVEKLLAKRKKVQSAYPILMYYGVIQYTYYKLGFNHRILCSVGGIPSGILFLGVGFQYRYKGKKVSAYNDLLVTRFVNTHGITNFDES